jgi:periplasmic glucans biosynthesis protein
MLQSSKMSAAANWADGAKSPEIEAVRVIILHRNVAILRMCAVIRQIAGHKEVMQLQRKGICRLLTRAVPPTCAAVSAVSLLASDVVVRADDRRTPVAPMGLGSPLAEQRARQVGTATFLAEVAEMAHKLAEKPYQPRQEASGPHIAKGYDDYRKTQFRPERGLWRGALHGFQVHGFPAGWLFKKPITLSVVEEGKAREIVFKGAAFESIDKKLGSFDATEPVPLSGFRINGPLNSPLKSDEIIVFQGASYFRALGKSQLYGLSARGLAIGTASPRGEEFPEFTQFWIEKPTANARSIRVYALLDSRSATGAFQFDVTPGLETVVDVKAQLYPRQKIDQIGLAPLTSMLLISPAQPTRVEDFRPRVHDSEALAILSSNGERVWRPLSNPRSLQVSAFQGGPPVGFGLVQRTRDFEEYEDLEARYDKRPTAWIEPKSALFDSGHVVLVEIPSEDEVHDNIVAFWRPSEPLQADRSYEVAYAIRWCDDIPDRESGLWVSQTRRGKGYSGKDATRFVVDYKAEVPLLESVEIPEPTVTASKGEIAGVSVQRNPETGGLRVTFKFSPDGADLAELRLTLPKVAGLPAETWLYRWTRGER